MLDVVADGEAVRASSVTVTPTMLTMVRVAELDHAPAGTQRTTSCGAKYGTALVPRSV